MKKVTYLSVMFFAIMLMSISCCKPDDDTPLPTDLIGTWNFKSLAYTYNGNVANVDVTDDCNYISTLIPNTQYLKLSLKNVTASKMTLYNECNNDNREYSYTFDGTTIDCESGSRVFQFISLTNGELKLKLISAKTTGLPIGGTYTFTR
jgi:hypothetical protein